MKKTKLLALLMAMFSVLGAKLAFGATAIANDTLSGLPQIGTDLGDFLSNLAPGVGVFIIILGIFGGIGAIVYAIVTVIRRKVSR